MLICSDSQIMITREVKEFLGENMITKFDQACNKYLTEAKIRLDPSCQKGYKKGNPKTKTIGKGVKKRRVNNCVPESTVQEKNATCTKSTKKASSTSKGKKWMKCVKSDSGGYKRIHWGQKGAKVTGKSGNTKRKKSFRARHKCSTAKSNTPRGQACKDW